MIDTHSHIYDEAYDSDFSQVVQRAKEARVSRLVMPGIDISCHQRMMSVAESLKGYALPCIGLHPTSVGPSWKEELDFVTENVQGDKFYAIGEIGIDKHWSDEFLKEQISVFEAQISLAAENNMPVIIHSREGFEEIVQSIKRIGKPIRGVFHAFNGSVETYERIRSLGDFFVGIGGVVTYKNAHIASSLPNIPISHILLETDAPWLTPVPHRGTRNESAYISYTALKVAETKGIPVELVDAETTKNAKELFNIED